MTRIQLNAPDSRMCLICSGMDFYYIETPGRNRPLFAELRKCPRHMTHTRSIEVSQQARPVSFTNDETEYGHD